MKGDAISVSQMRKLRQSLSNLPPNHTAGKMMSLEYDQTLLSPELKLLTLGANFQKGQSKVWVWLRGGTALLGGNRV